MGYLPAFSLYAGIQIELRRIAAELFHSPADDGLGALVYFDVISEGGEGTRHQVLTSVEKAFVAGCRCTDIEAQTAAAARSVAEMRMAKSPKVSTPSMALGKAAAYQPKALVNVVSVRGEARRPWRTMLQKASYLEAATFIAGRRDYGMYEVQMSFTGNSGEDEVVLVQPYAAIAGGSVVASKLAKITSRSRRRGRMLLVEAARLAWRTAILATGDDVREYLEEQALVAELQKSLRSSTAVRRSLSKKPTRLITLEEDEDNDG